MLKFNLAAVRFYSLTVSVKWYDLNTVHLIKSVTTF